MRKELIFLITVMVIFVGLLSGCEESLEDRNGASGDRYDAYQYFQECVLDVLIAPATAQFPSLNDTTIVKKDENTWGVVSYVDAQNTYGALIRKYYGCEIFNNKGLWSLSSMYDGDSISDVDHALYKWNLLEYYTDDDEGVDVDIVVGKKELTTNSFRINGDRWRFDWTKDGMMDTDYLLDPALFITPH